MSFGEAAREYVREGRIKEGLGVCKWRANTYKASLPTRAVPRPTPRAQPYCIGIGLTVPVSYTVSGPNCYSELIQHDTHAIGLSNGTRQNGDIQYFVARGIGTVTCRVYLVHRGV